MQTVLHFHPHPSKTVYENIRCYVRDTTKLARVQNLKCTKPCTFVLAPGSCFRAPFEKKSIKLRVEEEKVTHSKTLL